VTAVLVCLEGRSPQDAIEQCLRSAVSDAPARGHALSVWLSGALARPFLFGPVEGLRGWAEAHRAAEDIAPHACGVDGPCRVVLEGDPSRHGVIATAVQEETMQAVYRTAAALHLRIKSIRPAWAEAIDAIPAAKRNVTLLVCRDVDSLTLLGQHGDHYDLASTYAPRPGTAEVDSLLRRLQLSRDLSTGATLEVSIDSSAKCQPTVVLPSLETVSE
jgi:hypothetical protein